MRPERYPWGSQSSTGYPCLQRLRVEYSDYSKSENPPIIHRKELFVGPAYECRDRFAKLTAQEERRGLYADTSTIGFRKGWEAALHAADVHIRGHKVVRRSPTAPDAVGPEPTSFDLA